MPEDIFSPLEVHIPKSQKFPVVLSSPHSGRVYSQNELNLTNLSKNILRKSEDTLVDKICLMVSDLGIPMLTTNFPRAFIDLNRSPIEIDSDMFYSVPDYISKNKSLKVKYGLGVIPRVSAEGIEIYKNILPFSMARKRLLKYYFPYHKKLKDLLKLTYNQFGVAILLDCHSMPSLASSSEKNKNRDFDIIIGDNYGNSCGVEIYTEAEKCFKKLKFNVVRNELFSGGFITNYYGAPSNGIHAIQVELNRLLYLDKENFYQNENATRISLSMQLLVKCISKIVTKLKKV